jgi:hypothetical protein
MVLWRAMYFSTVTDALWTVPFKTASHLHCYFINNKTQIWH